MTKHTTAFMGLFFAAMVWTGAAQAAIPAGLLSSDQPSLAPMLEKVLPSVVNVMVTGKPKHIQQNPLFNDPFFRRFFGQPGQQGPQQGGREEIPHGLGSGVIVDAEKGIILTNAHVIEDAEKIQIRLNDNREFTAEVVGNDPESDIAVLQIKNADKLNLKALPIADSDSLRVGDFVVAIGNPFGLRQTVTSGIVSGLGRHGLGKRYEDFIQTDASINPGNSGGALVNMNGELVGINSAIASVGRGGSGSIGLGFAIPVDQARRIADQLIKQGFATRAVLGVSVSDAPDGADGALVRMTEPGGPAEEAGIEEGAVITRVDDRVVDDSDAVVAAIRSSAPGDTVSVTYAARVGAEPTTVDVQLGEAR